VAQGTSKRKLAAILSADVVGYSRLMQDDDAATVATLQEYRAAIARVIDRHSGRVVNAPGDNILAEFPSAVEAVQCAAETQKVLEGRNLELPAERRMEFRIGVNLGDIIEEADGTIYGDGVNVAARMESLATAGNVCISGKFYEEVQDKIEFKLEFMGDHSVKNIANPIPVYRVLSNGGQSPVAAIPSSGAILEPPALAVLPLTNMSGDPEQEYFADGLTEDLITALAAWRSFPVIARNSTFAYKGTSQDVRQVASELGARYILEGSVRKSGNRVRITAQLIDASSGHHVWAEKFDRDLDDVFAVQDEITLRIAATVEPAVGKIERKRSVVKPAKSLVAWDYYQRGMSELNTYTKTGSAQARVLFDQAIALDGTYSQAYSGMAWSHVLDLLLEHTPEPEESMAKLLAAAQRAAALDDEDSVAHLMLSIAYMWPNEDELSIAAGERAIELNPSNALALVSLGNILDLVGRTDEGIEKIESGLRLNPRDANNQIYMAFLGRAYLNARRYEQAAERARKAIHRRSDYPNAHYILAVSLAHLGLEAQARDTLDACNRIKPGFAERRSEWRPYRNPADNDHIHAGLKKIGR
jgi:adenylate cyclase